MEKQLLPRRSVWTVLWIVLGVVLILIPIPAVLNRYANYALFFPMYGGVLCILVPFVAAYLRGRWPRAYRAVRAVFLSLFGAGVVYFCAVSGVMIAAAQRPAPEGLDIIILGCGVEGDRPDSMMQGRLDAALAYLQANPTARAVCSGGVGEGKEYSEAQVMEWYLLENGIAPERILKEEQSTSTRENIEFSAALLDETDGEAHTQFALATDGYHQFRASRFAAQEGITTYPVNADTPLAILPAYWLREVIGITRMFLLGY